MLRTIKGVILLIFLSIPFGCSSNSSYLDDPNAMVVVTSRYESDAEETLPSTSRCSPPFNCADLKGASCAAALYHNGLKHTKKGLEYEKKEMYLSARVEILMASCRLKRAKKVLNVAKVTNYNDWKVATILGLEQRIQDLINFCEMKSASLEWKR